MSRVFVEFWSEDVAPKDLGIVCEAVAVLLKFAARTELKHPAETLQEQRDRWTQPTPDAIEGGPDVAVTPAPVADPPVEKPPKRKRRTKKELATAKAVAEAEGQAAVAAAVAAVVPEAVVDPLAIPGTPAAAPPIPAAEALIAAAPVVDPLAIPAGATVSVAPVAAGHVDPLAVAPLPQASEQEVKQAVTDAVNKAKATTGEATATKVVVDKLVELTGKQRVHEIEPEDYAIVIDGLARL